MIEQLEMDWIHECELYNTLWTVFDHHFKTGKVYMNGGARKHAQGRARQKIAKILAGNYLVVAVNGYSVSGSDNLVEIAIVNQEGSVLANYFIEPAQPADLPEHFVVETGLDTEKLKGHFRFEDVIPSINELMQAGHHSVILAENAKTLSNYFPHVQCQCFTTLTDPFFNTINIAKVRQSLALINALRVQGIPFFLSLTGRSKVVESNTLKRCINRCRAIREVLLSLAVNDRDVVDHGCR